MTWVILPGMDGTGELAAPFVALCPPGDSCVVVRYPREHVLTEEALVKVIEEFLPIFGDYVLVGESFSGQFAIRIAARSPARLRGVVLAATFAKCPVGLLLKEALFVIADILMTFNPPRWFVRRWLVGTDASTEQVETVRATISSVKGRVLASRLRMVSRCDVGELLRHVNVPTVVVGAGEDGLISRGPVEGLAATIPCAEVMWIDGPHLALFCRPAEVWRAIGERFAS